jgi:hypothetical protein
MSARRFPWAAYLVTFVVIVLFATAPLLSVYVTYLVAESHGCTVNEATIHPCIVLGIDLGGLLYTTGVLGWFMLATLPLGGGALIVWLVVLLIHFIASRQSQKAAS